MRAACTSQNPWRACRPPHFHVLDSANPDAPGATFYRYVLDRQRRRARRMEMSKLGRRTRLIRFMSTACGPHPTDRPTTDSARAHLPARPPPLQANFRAIFIQCPWGGPGRTGESPKTLHFKICICESKSYLDGVYLSSQFLPNRIKVIENRCFPEIL